MSHNVKATDLTSLRNRIRNLRSLGFHKGANRLIPQLQAILDRMPADEDQWVIETLFGMNGTQAQVDDLLTVR